MGYGSVAVSDPKRSAMAEVEGLERGGGSEKRREFLRMLPAGDKR